MATNRRLTWLAWTFFLLAVLLAVAELVVSFQNNEAAGHRVGFLDWLGSTAVFLPPITFTAVGAFIIMHHPRNKIGWLMIAVGLSIALATLMSDYPSRVGGSTRPLVSLAVWIGAWDWPLPFASLSLLLLLFPTGELPSKRWKPVLWIGLIGCAGACVLSAIRTGPVGAVHMPNPLGLVAVPESVVSVTGDCGFLALPAAMLSLILRFRSAQDVIRQQLKWFVYGAALAMVFLIASSVTGWDNPLLQTLTLAAMSTVPIFMGVAILRYRLYDIDVLISRTLVYGGLSLGVLAIYVVVVGYSSALLHLRNSVVPSLLVTALVGLIFQPARGWLQQRVNRLLFGERDRPNLVLARLGDRIADAIDPAEVLPTLVKTVADSLKLPYVALTIDGQDQLEQGAAVGAPMGAVISFPLVYQGERVGQLIVCPRRGEADLADADQRLLLQLAQRAGSAVHSVRLTRHLERLSTDLQRSREQLVLAREEERSRLRNDLHDGLAPRLAGLALSAGTIAELACRDPERSTTMAKELERAIRETVGEIRRLVYNLRPPTLDDLGLLAALQERAAQFGSNGAGRSALLVRTQLPTALPPLPAAVEVAVYRIVQEALMNVERHAAARRCSVALEVTDRLELVISDDGVGMPERYQAGVGLRSMRERAEELGGQFILATTEAGGARLSVTFPLPEMGLA